MTTTRTTQHTARVTARREQWIAEHGPCADCGTLEDLTVDHIDRNTKDPRLTHYSGAVWAWSKENRDRELAKCQVLCRPCHDKKTARENTKEIVHGDYRMFRRKCRCDKCRDAFNLHMKLYRRNLRRKK